MSDDHNIENLFRDKFKNYSPTPPDGLWDKIDAQIATQNNKGGIWFFKNFWGRIFSGLIILFLISFASAAYLFNTPKVYKKAKVSKLINSTPNKQEASFIAIENHNKKSNFKNSKNSFKNSNNSKQQLKEETNNSSSQPEKENSQLNLASNSTKNEESNTIKDNNKSAIALIEPPIIVENKSIKSTEESTENFAQLPVIDKRNSNLLKSMKLLSFQSPSINQNIVGAKFELEENPSSVKRKSYFIEAYGGPSIAFRRFSSNHNLMLNHKQEAESELLSYDWGLAFGVKKGNWEFSLGAQVERLGEKYDYHGLKEVHDTSITSHQHPLDPTVMVYDTLVEVHQNEVGHKTQNIYNYLTIPINVGYNFKVSPNFSIVPVITTGFNILLNAQASWLDPESLEAVAHSSSDNTNAYRKFNFSNKIQVGLHYSLTDKITFNVRPEAAMLWQSVFNNSEFLNHRPYSIDANLGLRYQF